MRVLQIMAGAEHGGAEAFFTRLVPALARAGVEQRVAIRRDAKRSKILSEAGIEPVELPFGGPIDLYTPFRLRREIKAFKPDIVLTWMNRATVKCPPGDFVHVGRLGGYYDLKYYQGCDHLIGNTEDIVGHLVGDGWPGDKAHYLTNFVSAARAEAGAQGGALHAAGRAPGAGPRPAAPEQGLRRAAQGDDPGARRLSVAGRRRPVAPRARGPGAEAWRSSPACVSWAGATMWRPSSPPATSSPAPSRLEPFGNVVIEAWAQSKCPSSPPTAWGRAP